MAYELKKSESVSAGIRRVAREQIDEALELLGESAADPEEVVHELRKSFKRIRAVARLVRGELGEEIYGADNAALARLGRRLAGARDGAARVGALDALGKTYEKDFPGEAILPLRRRLVSRQRAATSRLHRGPALSATARELEQLRQRVRGWPLRREGFECLEPGLARAYRQGKRARDEALDSRSDEALHAWRKRAKDLRYHVELLEPAWPEALGDIEKALHALTDHLGDDHDLAGLRRVLLTQPGLAAGQPGVTAVLALIDRRRLELQAAAAPLGARLYCEKPRAFSRRIESYWTAWRLTAGDGDM